MASPVGRDDQSRPNDTRPSKRVRITTTEEHSPSHSPARSGGATEPTTPRTRGPTACEKCRSRKTRCDNRRPCGYCAKHNIPCVYEDNNVNQNSSVTGEQILEAIHNLSDLVRSQDHRRTLYCHADGQDGSAHRSSRVELASSDDWNSDIRNSRYMHNEGTAATEPFHSPSVALTPLQSQGVESILTWEPLAPYRPSSCTFGDTSTSQIPTSQLPNIDHRELSRLEEKYIVGVHLKNPILDLADLHNKILQVSENGLDWSTRTCLVTLVCAIGALTQRYRDPENISITTPSPGVVRSSIGYESEAELSMQFWGIAARRLGFAIGQNDVEAVQCLCLAGIWHMHRLDALQAWKYFNLAGAAWHAVNMTDSSSRGWLYQESESSFTVMQSLYFTIWKSECELKFEIDVPGPILDNVEFPHAFPLPPNLNDQVLSPRHAQAEKGWYYYLAEIAARHMLNRLLRIHTWSSDIRTEKQIREMVAQADELEEQVQQWYTSLPPIFSFEIPTGNVLEPHSDELAFILRHRYMRCRELIGRPFVKLCVEKPLQIDSRLRSRVATLASQSLRFCLLRNHKVTPQLHQGTWFLLRNMTSSTLVLGAASMARKCPWLLGAQEMVVPADWKSELLEAVEMAAPYWEMNNGGASELRRLIWTVMDAVDA